MNNNIILYYIFACNKFNSKFKYLLIYKSINLLFQPNHFYDIKIQQEQGVYLLEF